MAYSLHILADEDLFGTARSLQQQGQSINVAMGQLLAEAISCMQIDISGVGLSLREHHRRARAIIETHSHDTHIHDPRSQRGIDFEGGELQEIEALIDEEVLETLALWAAQQNDTYLNETAAALIRNHLLRGPASTTQIRLPR